MTKAVEAGGVGTPLETAWRALDDLGHTSLVTGLRERFHAANAQPSSLVVVGEGGRGKSSLVSLLVGTAHHTPPGPHGIDGGYVVHVPPNVEHGPAPGRAQLQFVNGDIEEVAIDQLAGTAAEHRRDAARGGVVATTIRLPAAGPLGEVVVVDTPGVGGLDRAHGDLALRVARDATALLLVAEAGQELTAPELGFLARAADTVETVVIALAKRDKYPTAWPTVRDRDRHLLQRHAPRLAQAPIIATSASFAVRATTEPDPELASALRSASGVDDLVSCLSERCVDADGGLAEANVVRGTLTALELAEAELTERIAAVKTGEQAVDPARAERAELEELKQRSQTWGEEQQRIVARSRRRLARDLDQRLAEVEVQWRTRLAELTGAQLRDEQQLAALQLELGADLTACADAALEPSMQELAAFLVALFDQDAERKDRVEQQLRAGLAETDDLGPAEGPAPLAPTPSSSMGELLTRNALMGLGVTRVATALVPGSVAGAMTVGGLSLVAVLTVPIGLAAAAGLAIMSRRRSDAEGKRRSLQESLARAITRTRNETLTRADAAVQELRPDIARAVRDHVRRRQAQLNEVISAAQQAARAEPMARAKQAANLTRQRRDIEALRVELAASFAASGRGAAGTSPRPRASDEMSPQTADVP